MSVMTHQVLYKHTKPDGNKYKVLVAILKGGIPEKWLKHQKVILRIAKGNGITDPEELHQLIVTTLGGKPKKVYEQALENKRPMVKTQHEMRFGRCRNTSFQNVHCVLNDIISLIVSERQFKPLIVSSIHDWNRRMIISHTFCFQNRKSEAGFRSAYRHHTPRKPQQVSCGIA